MEYTRFETDKVIAGMENVRMDCARFEHVPGADESFAMLRIVRKELPFEEQIASLFALLDYLLKQKAGHGTAVFVSFFLSDVASMEGLGRCLPRLRDSATSFGRYEVGRMGIFRLGGFGDLLG